LFFVPGHGNEVGGDAKWENVQFSLKVESELADKIISLLLCRKALADGSKTRTKQLMIPL